MFGETIIAAARQHAIEAFPKESVGFVVAGAYERQDNLAVDPTEAFHVAPDAYLGAADRGLQAIIHSHPATPVPVAWPNAADMRAQAASAVPWGIIVCGVESAAPPFWFGDQCPIPPLLGRQFRHGVTDCCSLIRDWYRLERNVTLPVGERDWGWWKNGQDLYGDNFGPAGFKVIDLSEAERGDVFLAKTHANLPVPNHGGIYLGRGAILHHLTGMRPFDPTRLSCRAAGTHYLARGSLTHVLRYVGHAA